MHRLTEKYVDKFDLDIDGEEETAFVAGSSATVDDDGDAREDEFGYAFEGKDREGKTHVREFKAEPMPSALVTDVRRMPMETFAEEDEEEEEEEDEEEEEEEEEEEDGERSAAARAKAEAEADALRALEAEAQADRSRALEETAKTARPEDAAARAVAAAAKARVAREAAGVALPAKAKPTDPAPSRRLRERTDGDSDPNAESPKRTTKVADEWDAVNAARKWKTPPPPRPARRPTGRRWPSRVRSRTRTRGDDSRRRISPRSSAIWWWRTRPSVVRARVCSRRRDSGMRSRRIASACSRWRR